MWKLLVLTAAVCIGDSQAVLSQHDIPAVPEGGELWAVLVAGSNGWFNYRHQADVCHAYQIVRAHGISDDRIIVMMFDDIAHNKANPTPGIVINHPNGTDVYNGVPKDYTGKLVNPKVFQQVLRGEKISVGSGKTLNSTENDHVFVYFSDHGAKGLVAFGEEILKATELHSTITAMHQKKLFSKLVFYLEACESGSMFKGLLDPSLNVFATTASNATTSSFACYWDPKRQTFLGDVYSIKWLEDSDKENLEKESLEDQFVRVKKQTNTSTVCQYGDMSISKMMVGSFQGEKENVLINPVEVPPDWLTCGATQVSGPQVPVRIQERIIEESTDPEEIQQARTTLESLLKNRQFADNTLKNIVSSVLGNVSEDQLNSIFTDNIVLTQFDCYYAAVDAFHDNCFNLGQNDYALRLLNPFVNLCHSGVDADTIVESIKMNCDHPAMEGIY